MKQILNFTLLLLALQYSATAATYDFEVDGIYYDVLDNEAIVTCKHVDFEDYIYSDYTGDVTIPSTVTHNGTTYSVTSIGGFAFINCIGLTSVKIPNSVTSIGWAAFYGCTGLSNIIIPNSVTTIGVEAFYGCTGLSDIIIPNSVTTIETDAFFGCTGLSSIIIPNSVTVIGDRPFSNCSGVTSIIVDSGNERYDSRNNCNAIIETASNTLISGCQNTIIPNTVKNIGNFAFEGQNELNAIDIPNSITFIGEYAFNYCSGLKSVIIPNTVTTIGSYAFSGTTWYDNQPDGLVYAGLVAYGYKGTMPEDTIIIREGTYGIAGCAFRDSRLTSVTIPNSITNIGNDAFYNCFHLKDVYSYIVNPSAIAMHGQVFYFDYYLQDYSYRTLYVPIGSVAAYQADSRWSDYFGSIVEMAPSPGDVDADGSVSVADVVELVDLILAGSVDVAENPAADVNGNGIINIADVVELIDQLLN